MRNIHRPYYSVRDYAKIGLQKYSFFSSMQKIAILFSFKIKKTVLLNLKYHKFIPYTQMNSQIKWILNYFD